MPRLHLWQIFLLFIFTVFVSYRLLFPNNGESIENFQHPKESNVEFNEEQWGCYSDGVLQLSHDGPHTLTSGLDWSKPSSSVCPIGQNIERLCHNNVSADWAKTSTSFHGSDPPHENYFYSDCNVAAQAVLTHPAPDADLNGAASRFVVAWPAGNSGACLFFQPHQSANSALTIRLINSTVGSPLGPVFTPTAALPSVGIKGVIRFGSKANISLAIIGSVRAIRDYTEGPSLLHPVLQEGVRFRLLGARGLSISRLWLDNVTEMTLSFIPGSSGHAQLRDDTAILEPGDYLFSAQFNYPQLDQLSIGNVLRHGTYRPEQKQETKALSFLSYSEKILAGAWRFLTYFGRDDMISALLLQPVLTHTATEAVLGSVLERIDRTDGSTCHEEVIGDYAAFLNLEDGTPSTAARCDYSMIDTDYFLPILMHTYFVESDAGRQRLERLLSTPAGKVEVKNRGLTWGDLLTLLVNKIVRETTPFASPGGQKRENLIALRDGHDTGVWRDSVYGLGGGRIPFDVNVALAPAALRAIAALALRFGHSIFKDDWQELSIVAARYAHVWEDFSLEFFKLDVPVKTAQQRVEAFARTSDFYNGPSHAEIIDSDISYYALALDGHNGLDKVPILNTDACCRIFFLNGTNQPRVTNYLNSTALSIIRPFPAGLMTPLGLVIANPAYSGIEELNRNFSNSAYHGTVIWSWQQVAMARGLEKQLARCNSGQKPDFCSDTIVYNNVRKAYNVLWDVIEANSKYLSDEVWSWIYKDQEYHHTALSSLQPPPGIDNPAESNIIQLWSLTFLAVRRDEELR